MPSLFRSTVKVNAFSLLVDNGSGSTLSEEVTRKSSAKLTRYDLLGEMGKQLTKRASFFDVFVGESVMLGAAGVDTYKMLQHVNRTLRQRV